MPKDILSNLIIAGSIYQVYHRRRQSAGGNPAGGYPVEFITAGGKSAGGYPAEFITAGGKSAGGNPAGGNSPEFIAAGGYLLEGSCRRLSC